MVETEEQAARVGPGVRQLLWTWGPAVLLMAAIFYVSGQNTWTVFEGPPEVRIVRKLGHVFEYGLLALLVGRGLLATFTGWGARPATRRDLLRVWQIGTVIATLYAITDELHQLFVPRRMGSVWDVLLDALSATAALGIWYIWRVRKRARRET